LDSVLAQTFTDWEVICVDDGSTDGSGAILDEYAGKDKRFRVIHQANAGIAKVRQTGLDLARGEYLVAIDSDDYVRETFLEDFYKCIVVSKAGLIWCDYSELRLNGKLKKINEFCENEPMAFIKAMLVSDIYGSMWNKAVSLKFIRDNNLAFRQIPWCEDLCFFCELLKKSPRLEYLPKDNYVYRMREGSILRAQDKIKRFGPEHLKKDIEVMEVISQCVDGIGLEDAILFRQKGMKYSEMSNGYVSNEDFLAIYPHVKDMSGMPIDWVRRLLFRLAMSGYRREVLVMFRIFKRIVRGVLV
jgi:glycosyltransferase involved in cell wall biosynthesis